jgi:putative hemolysin
LEDFQEETGIELPEGPYETVAGYLIADIGALPELGMQVVVQEHVLTVVELDGRRVARIRVEPQANPGEPPDGDSMTESPA